MKVSVASGGEWGPFNENDVMVFNGLICKYICDKGRFEKGNFSKLL